MPRQGGVMKLPDGNPISVGSVASSVTMNDTLDDIADEITLSVPRDGSAAATANLPMGGFKHINVGAASLRNHYGQVAQIQDGYFELIRTVSGTANAITGALLPNIPATPVHGQKIVLFPTANNTTALGTSLNINGTGALWIVRTAGVLHIRAGDLVAGQPAFCIFDSVNSQWVLLNPRSAVLFSDLGGTISNAQVPVGAVTQHQGSIVISSLAGQVSSAQVPLGAVSQWSSSISISTFAGQVTNSQVPVGAVTQHQGSIVISALAGQVGNSQVPLSAVTQHFSYAGGSVALPGGLIFKWGGVTFGDLVAGFGSNTAAVTFPGGAFPNSVQAITFGRGGNCRAAVAAANNITLSGFTLVYEEMTSVTQGADNTAYWFAIGN